MVIVEINQRKLPVTTGDIYKLAHDTVLHRYRTQNDSQGRSQLWKFRSVEEALSTKRNTHILDTFIEDVELAVKSLEQHGTEKLTIVEFKDVTHATGSIHTTPEPNTAS